MSISEALPLLSSRSADNVARALHPEPCQRSYSLGGWHLAADHARLNAHLSYAVVFSLMLFTILQDRFYRSGQPRKVRRVFLRQQRTTDAANRTGPAEQQA